jgi:hypothetical protein
MNLAESALDPDVRPVNQFRENHWSRNDFLPH